MDVVEKLVEDEETERFSRSERWVLMFLYQEAHKVKVE
jgi:hypothetical protein